jgi:DNA-binding transcriptional ArsR family regulator
MVIERSNEEVYSHTVKPLHHPSPETFQLPTILYALSDPVRLEIVRQLHADGESPCGNVDLPVAKSTASHHFKVLREAGLIHVRQDGTQRCISLRRREVDQRFPGLLKAIIQSRD